MFQNAPSDGSARFVRRANASKPAKTPRTRKPPHMTLEEWQVALRRDTEKLLNLATELKQNVDKTSPSILSMDVIKKAQEIEKLAKSVKDKMKNAY